MSALNVNNRRGISVPDGVLVHGIDSSGHTVVLGTNLSGDLNVSLGGTTNVTANVSGQAVKISGETVVAKISGESINASVSGATVISKVSGEMIRIASGAYVIAEFSAVLTLTSGSVIIGDTFAVLSGSISVSSGNVIADTSGSTIKVASGAEIIWRIPITSGSVIVSGTVSTSVSGNIVTAKMSGEQLQLAGVASGLDGAVGTIHYTTYTTTENALDVNVMNTSVVAKVSGEAVSTTVSGNVVSIASGAEIIWRASVTSSSGNIVIAKISGDTVSVASGAEIIWRVPITSGSVIVSGTVGVNSGVEIIWRNAGISGIEIIWRAPIISGSVIVSGIVAVSGSVTILNTSIVGKVSGETVSVASGMYFASGIGVLASVTINSGLYLASGIYVVVPGLSVSGSIVQISGQSVTIHSANITIVSGILSASASGNIVTVASGVVIASGLYIGNPGTATVQSGVYIASGISVVSREAVGTSISSFITSGIKGTATQLPSVAGFAFVITNPSTNANMFLGGSGIASGTGYLLEPGQSLSPPINNLSVIYACAVTSGQRLSWMSVAY